MYEYGLPQDHTHPHGNGQGQASTSSSSPAMIHPSSSSDYRNNHLQQQQHHANPYQYAYDATYAASNAGPSSYDFPFARQPHQEQLGPVPTALDGLPGGYGNGSIWAANYQNGSTSASHDRNRDLPPWMTNNDGDAYGQMSMQGDMSRGQSVPNNSNGAVSSQGGEGEDWRKGGPGWGDAYSKQAAIGEVALDREIDNLRYNLNDLVESIRPYATSSSNTSPPRPPPYVQQRFIRLASTIQATLSTLQPHAHPLLHSDFTLVPPTNARPAPIEKPNEQADGNVQEQPSGLSSIKPLTAAEEEMEVIRKRRDMLIARAAQVQAVNQSQPVSAPLTQHPSNLYHTYPQSHQHPLPPPQQQQHPYSHMHTNTQSPPMWNHAELYASGGGMYNTNSIPLSLSTSNNGSPYGMPPYDDNQNMNARRPSMDHFDASLARFSLDPAKIGQGVKDFVNLKKNQPEGGCCHGCSVTVTAEWRRGPDGPRSLCNACGLHYAKLSRKRAQEEASGKPNQSQGVPSS